MFCVEQFLCACPYIHLLLLNKKNKLKPVTASRKYELLLTHSCIPVLELPPFTIQAS